MGIDSLSLWIVIAMVAGGTFALRFSFILALDKFKEPALLRRILRFVPAAVLAALISSSLFIREGAPSAPWENERLVAALIAALVAWKTKNMLLTILVGFGVLHLLG